MKSYVILLFAFCMATASLNAQKYYTKEGKITFSSDAPLEKIEAHNHKASSVMDVETGNIQWAVLIKAFDFEKALMQEHFNENYMESSKFPKATFKGSINNMADINLAKDGTYQADVSGELTIHGVTNTINTTAEFVVKGGSITATSALKVLVADYNIEIPAVVRDNIAKEVLIEIAADYQLLDKS